MTEALDPLTNISSFPHTPGRMDFMKNPSKIQKHLANLIKEKRKREMVLKTNKDYDKLERRLKTYETAVQSFVVMYLEILMKSKIS